MNERILITGAKGFIGSKTLEKLKKGENKLKTFEGDVCNVSDWQKNLKGGEVVFLIAGIRTETYADFYVNAYSINKLFEAKYGVEKLPKKLILSSSQAVYAGNKIPFKESDKPLPTSIYGQSKLIAERVAIKECQRFNIPLVILRYSTVLGKGIRKKSNMSGPLFVWVKAALANEPINVFQDGNQTRDYIHIEDVVRANILAIDLPSGIYNVGGGEFVRLIDLANWVKEAANSDSQIVIMGGKASKSDPREMFSDISKIGKFGWRPEKTAREAVEEFVASQL